jgi:hypothetical protein
MSSFVTNAATRRGKRARYGTTTQNAQSSLASHTDSTINTHLYKADTIRPKLRHAVIGNEQSNGLTIQGTHEFSRTGASNPDNRTIPLGTSGEDSIGRQTLDHLNRPDFPVRLNARGILTFPDPIKVKSIEGDLDVRGVITARSIVTPAATVTTFTPVLTDALGNLVTQTTSEGVFTSQHGDTGHLKISIIWSANALAAAEVLTITGLPSLKEGIYLVHAVTGMAVNNVGAHFIAVVDNDGDTLMSLHEVNNTTFAAQSPVTGSQTTTAGHFVINDIVRTH